MKMLCMVAALMAAATEARMFTTAKLAWMQNKGVNLQEVADSKAMMHSRAAKIDRRVQTSHKKKKARYEAVLEAQRLGQDPPAEQPPAEGEPKPLGYWEEFTYGLIQGVTAEFNDSCRDALRMTVSGAFAVNQFKMVYKPTSTAKFNLAMNQFTTGTSQTYAYCDFTALYSQLAELAVTSDYEQYVTLSTRVMGAMISDIPKLKYCVKQGKAGGLGYDVGLCRGKMFTTLLDVSL